MQTVRNLSTSSFKNIFKLMCFAVLAICILLFLEAAFQNSDSVTKRKKAILALPENSVDILFIGNSHAYCTFNPAIISSITGKRMINAGLPDQKIDLAYYTLKEMLDGQKPEIIVLEAFAFGRTNSGYQGYLANIDAMDLSLEKIRACFEIFPDKLEALRMCTRLYRCHNNWKHPGIIADNFFEITGLSSKKSGFGDGFYVLDSGMSQKTIEMYMASETSRFTPVIDEYSIGYFKRIASLCKEKNIRLIVAMAPMNDIYLKKINYPAVYDRMNSVCREQGVDYIDFSILYGQIGLSRGDFEDAFHDAQHTNVWGAEKVSRYMGGYIKDKILRGGE